MSDTISEYDKSSIQFDSLRITDTYTESQILNTEQRQETQMTTREDDVGDENCFKAEVRHQITKGGKVQTFKIKRSLGFQQLKQFDKNNRRSRSHKQLNFKAIQNNQKTTIGSTQDQSTFFQDTSLLKVKNVNHSFFATSVMDTTMMQEKIGIVKKVSLHKVP